MLTNIQLFVKSDFSCQTKTVEIGIDEKISALKSKICEKLGIKIPSHALIIKSGCKYYSDENSTVKDCQITKESTIYCKFIPSGLWTDDQKEANRLYHLAIDLGKNSDQAIDYLQKSANLGNSNAQTALGRLFLKSKTFDEAAKWLVLAEKNGHWEAQTLLGKRDHYDFCYETDFFKTAANLGSPNAQLYLWHLCIDGSNEIDYNAAVKWLDQAANQKADTEICKKAQCIQSDIQFYGSPLFMSIATANREGVLAKAGGCNGARIVKDSKGNALGIFKTATEENLTRQLKKFVGQARLLDNSNEKEQIAEVAIYCYSKIFGFNMTPAALMISLGSFLHKEKGAFIEFLSGYEELAKVSEKLEARSSYTKDEKIIWQKLLLLIYASLNFDPHDENIFVRMNGDKIADLKVIDGGNAVRVICLPGEILSSGKRSEPAKFKISKEEFEPEVLNFIKTNMTQANLNAFIARIKKQHPTFFTSEMDALHRKTLRLVQEQVLTGKIKTPSDLFQIITERQYNNFLCK